MFSKKNTEEQDALDWGTEAAKPAVASAAQQTDIFQPASGCVISAGTVFTGNVEANDNVLLEGKMTGDISSTGRVRVQGHLEGNTKSTSFILDKGDVLGNVQAEESLTIEPGSTLKGDAKAATAHINGAVTGNISVSGQLTLLSKAVIHGDVTAATLVMEAGCVVDGHLKVG